MNAIVPSGLARLVKRGWWRVMMVRQRAVNGLLSHLYNQPMQVLPAGHVGLAGAIVLWVVQDGGRQLVMVRNPKARDARARLVSFMGLGRHTDMSVAMKAAVRSQMGDKFADTLRLERISLDRVASAPMFTYSDEVTGIASPVQVLMWVMQVMPVQLELIKLNDGCELVLVNEQVLAHGKSHAVAPTHAALVRSVARHLPVKTLPREEDAGAREERLADEVKVAAGRLLH